jgi:cytochrome c556
VKIQRQRWRNRQQSFIVHLEHSDLQIDRHNCLWTAPQPRWHSGAMQKTILRALVSATVVLALPLRADEKPSEAYQKAMRDNGEAFQSVRAASKEIEESGAGAQDYTPFEKAAPTMKAAFATTAAFWQAKKNDDAVKLAQEAARLVGDMEDAAKERDQRLLRAAFTSLGETCTTCHMAHRVRLADGSYEVK